MELNLHATHDPLKGRSGLHIPVSSNFHNHLPSLGILGRIWEAIFDHLELCLVRVVVLQVGPCDASVLIIRNLLEVESTSVNDSYLPVENDFAVWVNISNF